MLTLQGSTSRLCDGLCRRDFLRLGSLGGLGLTLPTLLQAATPGQSLARSRNLKMAATAGRAKRCILLFLTGGPPQHDTWDLKPHAPAGIRGEFKPIATNVPGIRISEQFPLLSRQADRYCIVRSVTHGDQVHTTAGYTMLTGVPHPRANDPGGAKGIRPSADDHPHIGALLAKTRSGRGGVPVFASLPEVIKDAGVNEFPGQDAGFLGKRYGPFRIQADPAAGRVGPGSCLPRPPADPYVRN